MHTSARLADRAAKDKVQATGGEIPKSKARAAKAQGLILTSLKTHAVSSPCPEVKVPFMTQCKAACGPDPSVVRGNQPSPVADHVLALGRLPCLFFVCGTAWQRLPQVQTAFSRFKFPEHLLLRSITAASYSLSVG